MPYFPVYLDLRGRPCLVTGAGNEVDKKTEALLEAGARITVVTAQPSPFVRDLAAQGRIELHDRSHREGDLQGMYLAVAATTEDLDLSGRIAKEAEHERVLLNVVDVTALCTWIAPAIVRRGEVTVAISTNGISPAMARFVKDHVDRTMPEEFATLADTLAEVRRELRQRRIHPRPEAWQEALDAETLGLVARREWDAVQQRLLALLSSPRAQRRGAAAEISPC